MDFYPFVKCINPQRIRNKYTNELMLVNCGRCAACRSKRASVFAQKCELESLSHKHTYFVTLTYSQEYLPLAKLVYNQDTTSFDVCSLDETISFPNGKVCRYHEILHSYIAQDVDDVHILDMLVEKFNLNGYIPYLCKDDLQKFMKRLRKQTDKYEEKIRYFACGEYGPVHFRPHYHLIIWFESDELAQTIREIVHKTWSFGRVDVQKSQGKCSSYVAKYVNSLGSVPRLYQSSRLQPFSVHSQFLGEEVLLREKEEVYQLSARDFNKKSLNLNGVYTDVFLWRSLTSLYYPKCKGFASKSDNERLYAYTIYDVARKWTQETGAYKQAIAIVEHIVNYGWHHILPECDKLLSYFLDSLRIEQLVYQGERIEHCENDIEYYETFDIHKLIQQIYRELFVSKRFIYFCCNGDAINYWDMIKKIDKYYKDCDLLVLNQFYSNIEESQENNLLKEDDLDYLYADTYVADTFENVHFYKCFRSHALWKSDISVKHKKQNDLNKMFCY